SIERGRITSTTPLQPVHIQQKLGSTYSAKPIIPDNPFQAKFEDVANDEELKVELPYTFDGEGTPDVPIADIVDSAGKPIGNQSFTDTLIGIEVVSMPSVWGPAPVAGHCCSS
ncbi:hypothetical protein THAOC_23501, partial [Thalassiosira oceanica]